MSERDTILCPFCELNQFVTASGNCRRCNSQLIPTPEPEPAEELQPIIIDGVIRHGGPDLGECFKMNIKIARKKRNWSQDAMAAEIGCPRTAVGRMENGAPHPSLSTIQKYADAFGIPPFALLIRHPDFEALSLTIPERNK